MRFSYQRNATKEIYFVPFPGVLKFNIYMLKCHVGDFICNSLFLASQSESKKQFALNLANRLEDQYWDQVSHSSKKDPPLLPMFYKA